MLFAKEKKKKWVLFVPQVTKQNKILFVISETFPHRGLKNPLQNELHIHKQSSWACSAAQSDQSVFHPSKT